MVAFFVGVFLGVSGDETEMGCALEPEAWFVAIAVVMAASSSSSKLRDLGGEVISSARARLSRELVGVVKGLLFAGVFGERFGENLCTVGAVGGATKAAPPFLFVAEFSPCSALSSAFVRRAAL